MNASWMKWAGIADGAAIAALLWLGQNYPSIAWATPSAQVLGIIGTALGISHVTANTAPPSAG